MDRPQPISNGDWQGLVVYQIYPRSFKDSNGDGVGDLNGIIEKLDYLKGSGESLNVDAIWLSPFYPSPMADFGYDVADYCDVDPIFGTIEDFKHLLKEVHRRELKLIIDLVPNHTSSEHEWFRQSRQSKDNQYSDWYIWRDGVWPDPRDPKRMLPPNNWRDALTGDSAWEWNEDRQQFYLHSFDKGQPDLNWSNPEVREAIKKAMRFWLDMGVDGFRVDAVYWMGKEPLLTDDDYNPAYVEGKSLKYHALQHNNSHGWPVVYAYLSEMADVLKEEAYKSQPRFMITEAYPPDGQNRMASYMSFYVGMDPKVAAPFNFEGLIMPWEAGAWTRFLKTFHGSLENFSKDCISSYAFGNHDQPRLVSRIGEAQARAAAVLLLTLPGLSFIYNGEELGMKDVDIPKDKIQDPAAKGDPHKGVGRDPARTPMLWDSADNAGFTTADEPWLPISDDYQRLNVESQAKDNTSFLNLYRQLIGLRHDRRALRRGSIKLIYPDSPYVLGFIRQIDDEKTLTLVNFSDKKVRCKTTSKIEELILSSDRERKSGSYNHSTASVELWPYEAVLISLRA